MLIIADGWDELSTEDQSEQSFLYDLLFGEGYSLSVIVTSRPYASVPLHHLVNRLVEVCGFSGDNITDFIQCEFSNDKEKCSGLLAQLEGNPLIRSVCSVPLNCAIVCHLWHHFKGALPTTMSELYTKIILNVVLHNIQKMSRYENIPSLSHFGALPKTLQQPWSLVYELAFQTLSEDKIVFSHEDISVRFQDLAIGSEVFCFGLVQSAESIMVDGHGVSFHFLHLTFQEYLAALYLVRQPTDRQFQLCQSYAKSERFKMVWRFFFGLSFTICDHPVNSDVAKLLVDAYYHQIYTQNLSHFAFEAKHRSVDSLVVSKMKGSGSFNLFASSTFDFTAFIHVITNLEDQCTGVGIYLINFGPGAKQFEAFASALDGNLQVSRMDLRNNKLADQSLAFLFDRASSAFCRSLQCINLQNNMIGPKAITAITTVLAKSLPCDDRSILLDISNNPIGVEGIMALKNAMTAYKLANLKELSLAGSLTDDADTNAEVILALGSGHCSRLNKLDLSRNNLGGPGGKALGKVLPHLHSPVSLDLGETMLGDEGISALTQYLEGTCTIKNLQLRNNTIHDAGITCLAESMCTGLISMSDSCTLANNPIGLQGVMAVVKILCSDHFKADEIHLPECQLATANKSATNCDFVTTADIQQLLISDQRLRVNNNIYRLSIDSNDLSGEGIRILAMLMCVCPSLESLQCQSCGLTSDDLKQFFVQLSNLRLRSPYQILWWDLGENYIDNDGVSIIIQYLSIFPKLEAINLNGNDHVSTEMLKVLQEKLNVYQEVCLHACVVTII